LASASDDIQVQVLIEGWDVARHTLTCKLVDGATTYTSDSSSDVAEGNAIRRTFLFTPEDGVGITTFQVRLEGTTDNALVPYHISERTHVATNA